MEFHMFVYFFWFVACVQSESQEHNAKYDCLMSVSSRLFAGALAETHSHRLTNTNRTPNSLQYSIFYLELNETTQHFTILCYVSIASDFFSDNDFIFLSFYSYFCSVLPLQLWFLSQETSFFGAWALLFFMICIAYVYSDD